MELCKKRRQKLRNSGQSNKLTLYKITSAVRVDPHGPVHPDLPALPVGEVDHEDEAEAEVG